MNSAYIVNICLFGQTTKPLTLSWRRPLSYRNQFIDLLCKSVDWLLYDNGLRHETVNQLWALEISKIKATLRVDAWPCLFIKKTTNVCHKTLVSSFLYNDKSWVYVSHLSWHHPQQSMLSCGKIAKHTLKIYA